MKIDEAAINDEIIKEIESMDFKAWVTDEKTSEIDYIEALSYIDGMVSLGFELKRLLKE